MALGAFALLAPDDTSPWLLWIGAQTVCGVCIGLWSPRHAMAKVALIVAMQMVLVMVRVWMAGDPPGRDRSTGGAAGACILLTLLLVCAVAPFGAAVIGRTLTGRRRDPAQ